MDLHIHSPKRLRGVVLNYLSTGTTLPLLFILDHAVCGSDVHYTRIYQ
jgi:hypothetical protein